ncbi:MAG: tetratricopeptide repeat protein [Bacteroidota bacterium]
MIRCLLVFSALILLSPPLIGQELAADSVLEESIATLRDRSRTAQARSHYLRAKRYERNDELDQALTALNQAISLQHDFDDALWLRARIHRRNTNFLKALTDYQSLLFLEPKLVEPRFERAQLLYRLERHEESLEDFKYLLEHELGETTTVYFRGTTQTNEDGTSSFSTSSVETVQSGMKADIWNFMGLNYLALENYDKATLHFELALSQLNGDATIYNNLGLASEKLGDTLRAIDCYRRALLLDADHSEALQNFSSLTREYNRLETAETTLSQLSSTSTSPTLLLHQGMVLHQSGKYQEAISAYNTALRQAPSNADLYLQRGFSREKLSQLQDALQDYTQAIGLDSRLEKAYLNRGNVYYKLKKFENARQDYLTALQLAPSNAKIYYNLALTHHREGDIQEACRHLERALELGYVGAKAVSDKICSNP